MFSPPHTHTRSLFQRLACLPCSCADTLGQRTHGTWPARKDFRSKRAAGAAKTPRPIIAVDNHAFEDEQLLQSTQREGAEEDCFVQEREETPPK